MALRRFLARLRWPDTKGFLREQGAALALGVRPARRVSPRSGPGIEPRAAPGRRRAESFDRSIDVLVGRLRRKIEPDAKAPRLIKTVHGVGYKFAVRPQRSPAPDPAEAEARTRSHVVAVQKGERRQLTVLRCAIDSAGALAASLDPEDWRDTVAAFRVCCCEIVENFGGAVTNCSADDVSALFGYPLASEFDAERAIRAGLRLIDAVSRLSFGASALLRTRVGIANGMVVVETLGATGQVQPAASGEPSKLASALLSRAPAEAVLIAASTRQLVRGLFKQQMVPPLLADGFVEPIEAWRVIDAGETACRFLALRPPALSPLVGREEELEFLSRRWEGAKAGRGPWPKPSRRTSCLHQQNATATDVAPLSVPAP
jgi:class 3 adenylate cyclase